MSLALSAADLGDWSWDAASDVVTFSERAAEVFGIPPGPHMTWTAMQDLLHPDDRDRARREVEREAGRQYRTTNPENESTTTLYYADGTTKATQGLRLKLALNSCGEA